MSKVLVIGDYILDSYRFCEAERLCPEAPVPVLVPYDREERPGGAALVVAQLEELIGKENVTGVYGSKSRKERYFVDGHLVSRVDYDSLELMEVLWKLAATRSDGGVVVTHPLADSLSSYSLLIISDYSKGTFGVFEARKIMEAAKSLRIPVLVDAKNSWQLYPGAFAVFPNQRECGSLSYGPRTHVIQKLGKEGCSVDGVAVRLEKEKEVVDTTGAGDTFIAAFAAVFLGWALPENLPAIHHEDLVHCAKFANRVASLSVGHLGTHVVTKQELENN